MALALRISVPSLASNRYSTGAGVVFPRSPLLKTSRCPVVRGIRCAADSGASSSQGNAGKGDKPSQSQSSSRVERSTRDTYAGWSPLENDNEPNMLAGILKIGAGIALAFGFALVTYTAYGRQGSKHAVVYSVTTQQEKQLELPSGTITDDSEDAHKATDFDASILPPSNESKQEFQGEKLQPDLDSDSDLHQKKTAPGQDSFPSEEGELLNDEENVLSTEPTSISDFLESDEENDFSDAAEVDSKATSPVMEGTRQTDDGHNAASDVKESDGLGDDKASVILSNVPSLASDLAGSVPGETGQESPSESTSKLNVIDNKNEQSDDSSIGNAATSESVLKPEQSTESLQKGEQATESLQDAKQLMESLQGAKLSMASLPEGQQALESLQEVELATESLQEALETTESLQEAHKATESLQEADQQTVSLQETEQATESLQEALQPTESMQWAEQTTMSLQEPKQSAESFQETEQPRESLQEAKHSMEHLKEAEQFYIAVTGKHEAFVESEEETMLSLTASVVVPKGTAEDVIEFLGIDMSSQEVGLDLTATEPDHVNRNPSVIETLSSSLGSEFWHSESVGIPAPSTPSAAAQASPGSILVPATVDHEQEQALAALQALKVIEPGVEAGGLCTRREYARWLIASTSTLARSPAHKVFPAMYIENSSELAFNDVAPEDSDFAYIQGLAEAGLISSNLSRHDANEEGRSTDGAIFLPDSPVSRQDLVSWKLALEKHNLQKIDKQKLKAQSGFIDIDRISEEALPFLATDLAAGDRSIVATAFGFTRRFQPDKPVTRGQAAIALITGEAADAVAEEITRLEAEHMADAAVVAEFALEARAQKQVDEYFNTELKVERELRLAATRQLEELREELEKIVQEREDDRMLLQRSQAAVEAERELLTKFRADADEQLQILTAYRVEVGIEKDRLENLRREAEEENKALSDVKTEVEVEKKALTLARVWAEDEAKRARALAKILEEARKRWENQGIEVHVDKELDEENIPALTWQYSGPQTKLEKFLQRAPIQDFLAKAGDLKGRVTERFIEMLSAVGKAFCSIQEKTGESLQAVGAKAHELQEGTFAAVSKTAHSLQVSTKAAVGGWTSSISEGTRKIADGCRGEAQKLADRFKS